jgi:methylmalonyl-CoA mutase N-terminal domain/subunit
VEGRSYTEAGPSKAAGQVPVHDAASTEIHGIAAGSGTMARSFSGFATPPSITKRAITAICSDHGQESGLSVAFDLPTLMGLDADSCELTWGEVGKCGVSDLPRSSDMEDALRRELPLGDVSVSNDDQLAPASNHLGRCLSRPVAEKQGVPWEKLNGTAAERRAQGVHRGRTEFILNPPRPSMRRVPEYHRIPPRVGRRAAVQPTVSISGYHIREAGSTMACRELVVSRCAMASSMWSGRSGGPGCRRIRPRT